MCWRLNIFMLVLICAKYENNPSRTADVINEDGYKEVSNIVAVLVAKSLQITEKPTEDVWGYVSFFFKGMVADILVLISHHAGYLPSS